MTAKPVRPSLADMLPAKGFATRPEPLPPIENETPAAGGAIPQVEQAEGPDAKTTAPASVSEIHNVRLAKRFARRDIPLQ